MTVADIEPAPASRASHWRPRAVRLAVPAGYLLFALLLYGGLWIDPGGRYLIDSGQDQNQWEWFFAITADAVVQLDNPLYTTLQNYPVGVNLMANTVMLGVSVPLTPVTLLLGPGVTWVVVLTGSLAGTAWAWYWLFHSRLGRSRVAAIVGGGCCAFAPPVIAHGNGHPNFVALFVLPFLIAQLHRLWIGERPCRAGVILGLLLAYQIFLGEEALLLFASGMIVFALSYIIARRYQARRAARPMLIGLATAAAVSLSIVAFPLYWQFFGPQSYSGLEHGNSGNDLAALPAYAKRSLAGNGEIAGELASSTEQNAFFSWPLLILITGVAVTLRRIPLVRALSTVLLTATLLSLGSYLVVNGHETNIPGPWQLFEKLPLYESVLESRLTMICVPAIALLLAVFIDRIRIDTKGTRTGQFQRHMWIGALAAVLVPLAPTPYTTVDRVATPDFISQGMWREYTDDNNPVVVPIPVPSPGETNALHWQTAADREFSLPEGYFMGPEDDSRDGRYGAVPRPISELLGRVAETQRPAHITPQHRQQALADLRYWQADVVVLGEHPEEHPLRVTMQHLLGPPERVGGVWVWDVRHLP